MKTLFGLPRLPRLDLPPDLRVAELRPAPKPRLTVKRRTKSGYATADDRLIGDALVRLRRARSSPRATSAQVVYSPPGEEVAKQAKARAGESGEAKAVEGDPANRRGGSRRRLRRTGDRAGGGADHGPAPGTSAPPQTPAEPDPAAPAGPGGLPRSVARGGLRRPAAPARVQGGQRLRLLLQPQRQPAPAADQAAQGGGGADARGVVRRGRGQALPPARRVQDRGQQRHRLVRAARRASISAARPSRCPQLLAALRRGEKTVRLDDGTFGVLPEEWLKKYGLLAGMGDDRGRPPPLQHAPGRPARRAARGAAARRRCDAVFRAGPRRAAQLRGRRAGRRARRLSSASCAPTSARAWAGSTSSASSASAAAWPTTWAWARRCRCWRCSKRAGAAAHRRRTARRRAPRAVAGRRAAVADVQLEAGGRASSRRKLRVLDHTGIGRAQVGRALRRLRPGPDHLRHAAPRRRRSSRTSTFDYVVLDEAQAIKNAASESAKAARLLQGRPPPGAERHAGAKPPRRTVEPVRVPQPRHAGHRHASSRRPAPAAQSIDAETRDAAVPRAAAVHPAPHQGAGGQGAAAASSSRRSTASWTPTQRKLYDELREHYRQSLLARIATRGDQQGEDPDPRSAAAAAPGGLPSRA